MNNRYGSLDATDPDDDETRRWSIGRKFQSRYYCRIRSFEDCLQILSVKCLFATAMLALFVLFAVFMVKMFFAGASLFGDNREKYDYIIIGSGPSGSLLTRRLVDEGKSVLLIEAGDGTQYDLLGKDYFGGPLTRFDIPLFWSSTSQYPETHWTGFNVPHVLIGKGLGGSGVLNAMLYVRCVEADLLRWNVTNWTWEYALQLYKTLENYHLFPNESLPYYRGRNVESISTTRPLYIDPIASDFVSAAVASGILPSHDFNAPNHRIGAGYYDFTIQGGIRDSAAKKFLGPILRSKPDNFNLLLKSTVSKILLESQHGHKRAIGVEYISGSEPKHVYLSDNGGDVIVCAGALMTPKLLMNSGIGPRSELEKAKIEVKVPLEGVGKDLVDHPALAMVFEITSDAAANYPSAYDIAAHWNKYVNAVERYRMNLPVDSSDFGVLGSVGLSSGAFLVSPHAYNKSVADVQLTVFPSVAEPHVLHQKQDDSLPSAKVNQMLITIALLDPDARQEVVLNATSPESCPLIVLPKGRSAYLSDRDVLTFVWSVKRVRKIFESMPLQRIIKKESSPGQNITGSELYQWTRSNAFFNSHWTGTAKMGKDSARSVVGEDYRVHHVHRLRVADASVLPYIPNGNVHSTVLMTAARASEMILREISHSRNKTSYRP